MTWSSDPEGVVDYFSGVLLATKTERLVAEFADGDEVEIPVVWVSPPIDAGFYVYWVAAEHRRPGRQLTAVTAEDADGDVLARQTFRLTPAAEIRRPARLPSGERRVPAGEGDRRRGAQADRLPRRERPPRHALADPDPRRRALLPAQPRRRLPAARARRSHGRRAPRRREARPLLRPGPRRSRRGRTALPGRHRRTPAARVEGFVLHEIEARHYEREHRLDEAIALAADGRVLERQPFHPESSGTYPCEKPVDIGRGVIACP